MFLYLWSSVVCKFNAYIILPVFTRANQRCSISYASTLTNRLTSDHRELATSNLQKLVNHSKTNPLLQKMFLIFSSLVTLHCSTPVFCNPLVNHSVIKSTNQSAKNPLFQHVSHILSTGDTSHCSTSVFCNSMVNQSSNGFQFYDRASINYVIMQFFMH